MHNLLKILIFTLRNFTKLPILRYLGICNVLYIWHIRAIPTYRVYRLYDYRTNSYVALSPGPYIDLPLCKSIDCVFPCTAASQPVRCYSGEGCRQYNLLQQYLLTPDGCCSSFPNILKTYSPTGTEECARCGSCKFVNQ